MLARIRGRHRRQPSSPGRPSDRRQSEPGKITVQGARRASRSDGAAGAALDGDLARLKTGAPGGWPFPRAACSAGVTAASRGRAVPWVAHGRQPAVCRRCKGGAASPEAASVPAGASRPPRRARPSVTLAARARLLARDQAPSSARRAPRALEDEEKVLTDRESRRCAVPLDA